MKQCSTLILPFLSLLSSPLLALDYTIDKSPSCIIEPDCQHQLTPAERNYALSSMALFVDAVADDLASTPEHGQHDSLIKPIVKRLRATDVPTDALSPSQRAYLGTERKIQIDALTAMVGASVDEQVECFAIMREQLRVLSLNAGPEVKKLQLGSDALAPLSRELQIEDKISTIMQEGLISAPDRTAQEARMVSQLRALAKEVRAKRTPLRATTDKSYKMFAQGQQDRSRRVTDRRSAGL